ncbi:MAG: nucleotidyltransferase [Legionellaceae bacterium]|nr:nucleotidyltransferase [Legionellaceae bacterium]|tara:strand:- start:834 stop:1256 length:423 start_codon:yes stop_codon:yes gene_type:complete
MVKTRDQDIRWQQRLSNFSGALEQLAGAVNLSEERELSLLERQGLIQAFEFTHELAWKVMRDYAQYQGNASIAGSRDATRAAFEMGLLKDGDVWMEMIKSRNQTSHTYNKSVAEQIIHQVLTRYYSAFKVFSQKMESLKV